MKLCILLVTFVSTLDYQKKRLLEVEIMMLDALRMWYSACTTFKYEQVTLTYKMYNPL